MPARKERVSGRGEGAGILEGERAGRFVEEVEIEGQENRRHRSLYVQDHRLLKTYICRC